MQGIFQIIGAITLPSKKKLCAKLKINRSSNLFLITQWSITFILINLSWLMFRADGLMAAINMFKSIFVSSPLSLVNLTYLDFLILGFSLLILWVISYYHEKGYCIRDELSKMLLPIRWAILLLLFSIIVLLGIYGPGYSASAFIYMSF